MIRTCRQDDVPEILLMIHELAEYERVLDSVELTADELHSALFDDPPTAFAHLAVDDATGETLGFALWHLNFSSWQGTGIHLEDIYVRPAARGSGLGTALLGELARICTERGYRRLEWWVLKWNTPAIDFYASLGAVPLDELSIFRLAGPPLAEPACSGRTAAAAGGS